MNIALWIEEGFEEGEPEMLKDAEKLYVAENIKTVSVLVIEVKSATSFC